MKRLRKFQSIRINLNFHGLQIDGIWKPNDCERKAAWELYVEIITCVSTMPPSAEEGLLREAFSSLNSLSAATHDILLRYGPDVAGAKPDGQYSFGTLALAMPNYGMRHLLADWQSAFDDWEAARPRGRSQAEHERAWNHLGQLRADLNNVREVLILYARLLAVVCGIPDLLKEASQMYQGKPETPV